MPRYQLIVRQETFIRLAMEASKRGKSFGKLVNEILDSYAERLEKGEAGDVSPQAVCIVCGAKAKFMGHGRGQQKLYVCPLHKGLLKDMEGYKEI
jgi:hypothetical protein